MRVSEKFTGIELRMLIMSNVTAITAYCQLSELIFSNTNPRIIFIEKSVEKSCKFQNF